MQSAPYLIQLYKTKCHRINLLKKFARTRINMYVYWLLSLLNFENNVALNEWDFSLMHHSFFLIIRHFMESSFKYRETDP